MGRPGVLRKRPATLLQIQAIYIFLTPRGALEGHVCPGKKEMPRPLEMAGRYL